MSRPDHLDVALADLERYVANERAVKDQQAARDFYIREQQQQQSYSPMYVTSPHTNRVFSEATTLQGSINRRTITTPGGTHTLSGTAIMSSSASPFSPPPQAHSGFDAPVNSPMYYHQQRQQHAQQQELYQRSVSPRRDILGGQYDSGATQRVLQSVQERTSSPYLSNHNNNNEGSPRRILTDAEIFAQARRETERKYGSSPNSRDYFGTATVGSWSLERRQEQGRPVSPSDRMRVGPSSPEYRIDRQPANPVSASRTNRNLDGFDDATPPHLAKGNSSVPRYNSGGQLSPGRSNQNRSVSPGGLRSGSARSDDVGVLKEDSKILKQMFVVETLSRRESEARASIVENFYSTRPEFSVKQLLNPTKKQQGQQQQAPALNNAGSPANNFVNSAANTINKNINQNGTGSGTGGSAIPNNNTANNNTNKNTTATTTTTGGAVTTTGNTNTNYNINNTNTAPLPPAGQPPNATAATNNNNNNTAAVPAPQPAVANNTTTNNTAAPAPAAPKSDPPPAVQSSKKDKKEKKKKGWFD